MLFRSAWWGGGGVGCCEGREHGVHLRAWCGPGGVEGQDEKGRWVESCDVRVKLIFRGDFEDFRHGGL